MTNLRHISPGDRLVRDYGGGGGTCTVLQVVSMSSITTHPPNPTSERGALVRWDNTGDESVYSIRRMEHYNWQVAPSLEDLRLEVAAARATFDKAVKTKEEALANLDAVQSRYRDAAREGRG